MNAKLARAVRSSRLAKRYPLGPSTMLILHNRPCRGTERRLSTGRTIGHAVKQVDFGVVGNRNLVLCDGKVRAGPTGQTWSGIVGYGPFNDLGAEAMVVHRLSLSEVVGA